MTALYIIGGIILFIIILLYIPVVADMEYMNKKFTLRVKYLIFTVFSVPADPKKKKRKKKPKKQKKEKTEKSPPEEEIISENKEEKPPEKLSVQDKELLTGEKSAEKEEKPYKEPLSDKIAFVLELIKKCKKNVFNIVKDIGIKKLRLDMTVGTPDASETALTYGKISMSVWNAVAFLQTLMRKKFSAKAINIGADFLAEETKISASVTVTITPAAVLGNLIAAAVKALIVIVKRKNKLKKSESQTGKEK